eukprot:GHVT01000622.1.p1 GENE.GHVT01000622.1~~GHVT01000622.1.p1  ORF type:complete len:210 (+),score=27.12 GHVT01000622.1:286-915(+)
MIEVDDEAIFELSRVTFTPVRQTLGESISTLGLVMELLPCGLPSVSKCLKRQNRIDRSICDRQQTGKHVTMRERVMEAVHKEWRLVHQKSKNSQHELLSQMNIFTTSNQSSTSYNHYASSSHSSRAAATAASMPLAAQGETANGEAVHPSEWEDQDGQRPLKPDQKIHSHTAENKFDPRVLLGLFKRFCVIDRLQVSQKTADGNSSLCY